MKVKIQQGEGYKAEAFGKMDAIKRVRALGGLDLREAKRIVEAIQEGLNIEVEVLSMSVLSREAIETCIKELRKNGLMVEEEGLSLLKVRIAVVVDPDGKWSASGWHIANNGTKGKIEKAERAMMDGVIDDVGMGEARYWVEAELPVPVEKTVQGEVKENEQE